MKKGNTNSRHIETVTIDVLKTLLMKHTAYASLLSDFNANNTHVLETFVNYFKDCSSLSTSKIYEKLIEKKNELIRSMNFEKQLDYKMSVDYYLKCGWSLIDAKKKIISHNRKGLTLFTKGEVLSYLKDVNPYSMNVDNDEFLNMFVDTYCNFKLAVNIHRLDLAFKKLVKDVYANDDYKGFATSNVYYYISRGFDEQYATETISKIQRERSLYSKDYYTKRGIEENLANEIISQIQSLTSTSKQSDIDNILKKYNVNKSDWRNDTSKKTPSYTHNNDYKINEKLYD